MNTKKSLLCAAVSALIFGAAGTAQAQVVRTCGVELTYTWSITKASRKFQTDGEPGWGGTVLMARRDSAANTREWLNTKLPELARNISNNDTIWSAVKTGEYISIRAKIYSQQGGSGCTGSVGPVNTRVKGDVGSGPMRRR